ncbi:hypothetical protein D3C77_389210 [compost metagenome]
MNIDKSKLQPLLWAVVGAWRAGDQDLHLRTDALDVFLGETTLEEVALWLLAEIERMELIGRISCNFDGYKAVLDERDQLKAENEALRASMKEMCAMYTHVWDREDGALVCFSSNVERFDKAHEAAWALVNPTNEVLHG